MVLPLLKLTLPRDIQPTHPALLPASLFFNCNVIIQKWFKSSRSLYLVLRWWPWWLHWWLNRRTLEIFAATRRAPAVKQTHQSEHSRGWSSMSVNPTSNYHFFLWKFRWKMWRNHETESVLHCLSETALWINHDFELWMEIATKAMVLKYCL